MSLQILELSLTLQYWINFVGQEVQQPLKQCLTKTFEPINYFLKNDGHNCQIKKKSGLGLEEAKKQREEFYDKISAVGKLQKVRQSLETGQLTTLDTGKLDNLEKEEVLAEVECLKRTTISVQRGK